jgi:hypothetical protein
MFGEDEGEILTGAKETNANRLIREQTELKEKRHRTDEGENWMTQQKFS